ncbi:MAG: hypothetical protein ACLRNQ_29665 [Flavonifractor plautii]
MRLYREDLDRAVTWGRAMWCSTCPTCRWRRASLTTGGTPMRRSSMQRRRLSISCWETGRGPSTSW